MSRTLRSRSIRFPRRSWQAALVLAVAAVVGVWQQQKTQHESESSPSATASASIHGATTHRIARVVDGDTLQLAKSKERVRLIGANTPETVKQNWPVEPWGPEASQFTKEFVAGGEVRLEYDVERQDRYGRTLAYVWVGDRMLNEELIRAGLAKAEMQYRYSKAMKARFREAEREAKAARRGIWSAEGNNS
jgi:micrococcal nuclease